MEKLSYIIYVAPILEVEEGVEVQVRNSTWERLHLPLLALAVEEESNKSRNVVDSGNWEGSSIYSQQRM